MDDLGEVDDHRRRGERCNGDAQSDAVLLGLAIRRLRLGGTDRLRRAVRLSCCVPRSGRGRLTADFGRGYFEFRSHLRRALKQRLVGN